MKHRAIQPMPETYLNVVDFSCSIDSHICDGQDEGIGDGRFTLDYLPEEQFSLRFGIACVDCGEGLFELTKLEPSRELLAALKLLNEQSTQGAPMPSGSDGTSASLGDVLTELLLKSGFSKDVVAPLAADHKMAVRALGALVAPGTGEQPKEAGRG